MKNLIKEIGSTTNNLIKNIPPEDMTEEYIVNNHYANYYKYKNSVGIRLFLGLTLNKGISFREIDKRILSEPLEMGIVKDKESGLYHLAMQTGEQEILLGNCNYVEGNWQRVQKANGAALWLYMKGENCLIAQPSSNINEKIQSIHSLLVSTQNDLKLIISELERCYNK